MPWELKNDRPIYLQLIEQISYRIISGTYPIGSRLPSVRDLAAEASVNPNTMQKALAELERSELIFSNRTSGRFITEDADMIETMKFELAKEQFKIFLSQLKKLGYNEEQIKTFIMKEVK